MASMIEHEGWLILVGGIRGVDDDHHLYSLTSAAARGQPWTRRNEAIGEQQMVIGLALQIPVHY